jgi:4-hydroxybenzoyl-CoA thioesterase
VAHFAVEAIEAWFLERLDLSWLHTNRDLGIGTPVVRMEVDFVSMMRPPDLLATEVALIKAGRSSLTFRLTGRIGERLCWRAHIVCAFASADAGRSVAIPAAYRAAIARELALTAGG